MSLIVMGRLGRSGISKFLVGGLADKVLHNSKIPVLDDSIADNRPASAMMMLVNLKNR